MPLRNFRAGSHHLRRAPASLGQSIRRNREGVETHLSATQFGSPVTLRNMKVTDAFGCSDDGGCEMDGQAKDLAARFAAANRDVIAAIEEASDAQLAEFCPAEQCTRAALGCHVAEVHHAVAEWLRGMLANGAWPAVM